MASLDSIGHQAPSISLRIKNFAFVIQIQKWSRAVNTQVDVRLNLNVPRVSIDLVERSYRKSQFKVTSLLDTLASVISIHAIRVDEWRRRDLRASSNPKLT